jgi:putative ABC transport system permease protein
VLLFSWFIVRRLRQDAARSALTVLGIALGVAVVIAIRIANVSAVAGFAAALDTVAGRTSLEVIGAGTGIAETRLADLGWLQEWGDISPVIEADAMADFGGAHAEAVRVLGVDVLRDQPFRDYRVLDPSGARRALAAQQFLELLVDPSSVVVPGRFARRHGLSVGAPLRLAIGDRIREFRVRGLLGDDGPARVLDGNFVLMDIAAAQIAFEREGHVDRVDLLLRDPGRLDEAERRIGAALPAGLAVQRPSRRGAQVERMLAAFQFNLGALSYVALIVGLFLVYNTVATSVIARREEIGVLRAIGTSRARVLLLFLGEATMLAIVGCAMGALLGWVFAWGAVHLTSATVNALYVTDAAAVPGLTPLQVLLAFAIGVPLALAAAAAPGLEAARVSPLDAIRNQRMAGTPSATAWRSFIAALACLGAAALLTRPGPVQGLPVFGVFSAVAVVAALACLVPGLLRVVAHAGAPLARALGIEARLAHANLAGALPRLGVSVAALGVSLAMLVAIAVMIGSFRETVIYWVGQTLQADLFIASAQRPNLDIQPTISRELEQAVASDPDVAALGRFRALTAPFRDRLIVVGGGDFGTVLNRGTLVIKTPREGRDAIRRAMQGDAALVSESFSLRFGVSVGDTIALPGPRGIGRFAVAAVYYDYSTDRGVVMLDRGAFERHYGPLRPSSLTVYLRPGASPDVVRDRLLADLGRTHRVFIHTNASLRAEVLRIFDATFAVTYGLEAIAILVAMLGVTTTLVTLALERRQELAMLRVVGADAGQVRRMVMIEAALLGVIGEVLGLAGGFALALILVNVINVQSFGWTIQLHVPALFLTQALLALLAATTVAGLYPARVAAGFQPAMEVTGE